MFNGNRNDLCDNGISHVMMTLELPMAEEVHTDGKEEWNFLKFVMEFPQV